MNNMSRTSVSGEINSPNKYGAWLPDCLRNTCARSPSLLIFTSLLSGINKMNKDDILQTAITLAREIGLVNLSRGALCERLNIPEGSFLHHAGQTFADLFAAVRAVVGDAQIAPITRKRVNPELRARSILASALEVARTQGFQTLTRARIAEHAGISPGLVARHWSTTKQLNRAIMRAAIEGEVLEVIAEGLAAGNEHARKAPEELKRRAAELMLTR